MPSWIGKSLDLIVYVHKSDYGIHRVRWAMWKTKNDNILIQPVQTAAHLLKLISSYLLKTWRNLCRLYTFYSLGTICDIIAVYDIIVDQALYSRFLIVSNLNFLVLSIPVIFTVFRGIICLQHPQACWPLHCTPTFSICCFFLYPSIFLVTNGNVDFSPFAAGGYWINGL